MPRSSEDGVYTRRGCEDVSSCATKADSFRVENIKPGDSILSQFRRFVSDARKHHQEQFSSYKHNYTRLDSFLCDRLSKD